MMVGRGDTVMEALGNIGDFLGGIGVVITLVYLAGQIRQNTRSIRTSAFQAAQRDIVDKLDGMSSDPELVRIYFDGNHKFESFSKEDRRRYATFMTGFLRRYENLLYQTRLGNIDREQWEGVLAELRTAFNYPGARAWWAQANGSFNRELREFVEREVFSPEPRDPE
jgi:hypothetical protein